VSSADRSVQVHVQPDPAGIRLFIYDRNGHASNGSWPMRSRRSRGRIVVREISRDLAGSARSLDDGKARRWDQGSFAAPQTATSGPTPLASASAPAHPGARSRPTVDCVATPPWPLMALCGWRSPGSLRARSGGFVWRRRSVQRRHGRGGNGRCSLHGGYSSNAACTEPRRKLTRMGGNALMTADLPCAGSRNPGPGIGLGAAWLSTNAVLDNIAATPRQLACRGTAIPILLALGAGFGRRTWASRDHLAVRAPEPPHF